MRGGRSGRTEPPRDHYVLFDCQGEEPNVAYLSFAVEQGSFLAGAAAALESETGVIGFIGAVDHPFIWPYQAGFEAGARAVDPGIDIRSTYLRLPPDGRLFENDARAFEVAAEMYRDGADIIYGTAGGLSTGVIQAAVELSEELLRHLWVIGVDTDVRASLSTFDPWRTRVLTSMMKQYDPRCSPSSRSTRVVSSAPARGRLASPPARWTSPRRTAASSTTLASS